MGDDEIKLRYMLFLFHGAAGHAIYGDDGERQCNSCMIDFKQDSVGVIERKTSEYSMKLLLKGMRVAGSA